MKRGMVLAVGLVSVRGADRSMYSTLSDHSERGKSLIIDSEWVDVTRVFAAVHCEMKNADVVVIAHPATKSLLYHMTLRRKFQENKNEIAIERR